MNIDDMARRAGQDLRERVRVDVQAALEEFQRVAPRRRRAHVVVGAVAVASLVLILAGAAQWLGTGVTRSDDPVDRPTEPPFSSPSAPATGIGCQNARITCDGGRSYTVHLDVPMTWELPPGFGAPYSGAGPTSGFIETYLDGHRAGVSVFQHVAAAALKASADRVSSVRTAEEFVNWVASRPFLSSSTVRAGEFDGRPAWSVEVEVPPGAPDGPGTCNSQIPCYPIMALADGDRLWIAGTWEGMTGRYTALDLPGSGITVVWSWSFGSHIPSEVDDLVGTIRFE
jgi:hypothetical protein